MNKKWILPAVTLTGLVFWAGLAMRSNSNVSKADFEPMTVAARKGPMIVHVQASGEIKAIKLNKIIPQIKTKTTISYLVPEGTRVNKDDVVARLDGEDLRLKIEELEQLIANQEIVVSDAQADAEIQKIVNQTNLKVAQDAVRAAEMELRKFEEADTPMNARTVDLTLQTAESELIRSESRFKELNGLIKEGFITEDEVEEGRINLETAKVNVETARMDKRIMNEFTIPLKQIEIGNKLNKAQTDLKKTMTENTSLLNSKVRKYEIASRSFGEYKRKLNERLVELDAFTVVAPTDGVVKYGDSSSRYSRYPVEVGQGFSPGLVLLTIPDLSQVKAEVDVAESEIQRVQVGQRVTLQIDAVADQLYNGRIAKVAEVANSQSYYSSSGVKEFEVEISIDDDSGLKPGFSCEAEILTDKLDSVLQLPVQCVFNEEDRYFVYLKSPGGPRRQEIALGRSSITHVEIRSGLEEGQQVYLARPADAE